MAYWESVVGPAIVLPGSPLHAAGSPPPSLPTGPTDGAAPFRISAESQEDSDGTLFLFRSPVQDGTLLTARVLTPSGYVRTRTPSMADADGDFIARGTFVDGVCLLYVPAGAIDAPPGLQSVALELIAMSAETLQPLGLERLTAELRVAPSWSEAAHWRPLIGLCLAVAHADGALLAREASAVRRIVEEGLAIGTQEEIRAQTLLEQEPTQSVAELTTMMQLRFPRVPLPAILEALCDVARADGYITQAKIDVIRNVAVAYEVPAYVWLGLARTFGLTASEDAEQ